MGETEDNPIQRNERGQYVSGQSGNPTGGSKSSRRVRERIAERLDDVLASLFLLVDHGDTSALRLALERVCPPIKADSEAEPIAGLAEAATMPDKANAVLNAVARGALDADRAAKILQAITNAAQLSELEELKERIAKLENPTGDDLV